MQSKLPVLVLAFNRVDKLQECLESVMTAGFTNIYISSDGPRSQSPNECIEVHALIRKLENSKKISACKISKVNSGTLDAIFSGIDWFFENVDYGLIIEDDLKLASNSSQIVENLMTIIISSEELGSFCLYDPLRGIEPMEKQVRQSRLFFSWGWGTTAQKWRSRTSTFSQISNLRIFLILLKIMNPLQALRYLQEIIVNQRNEKNSRNLCNWDLYWEFTHWRKSWRTLLSVLPCIENTGWGEDATHTKNKPSSYKSLEAQDSSISQSVYISDYSRLDKYLDRKIIRRSRKINELSAIRNMLKLGAKLSQIKIILSRSISGFKD